MPRAGSFVYSLAVSAAARRFLSDVRHARPRAWLVAGVVVLVLALAAQLRPVLRARALPTGTAQWIWQPFDARDHNPAAFYAARDFALGSPPSRARLLIAADEGYVVTLNGKRIGAGGFSPGAQGGAPLDVYEVGPLLLPGGNRLLVELRSARGAGGLLASLLDEASGRQLVGTDRHWRILRRHELGLVRGWLPIRGGEPALCWGYPPIGRWGRPTMSAPRPLLAEQLGSPQPALLMRPLPLDAGLAAGRLPGSSLLYDWGRPVEGYLRLEVPPAKELGTALLFVGDGGATGDRPPDPLAGHPAAVLILPGERDWMDSLPRRFRYALLVGLAQPAVATALPVALPVPGGAVRSPRPSAGRVFGIAGPPLRTPVEDEVWGKLQRLAGVAGRKEL
jgi:hypothetical protein